MIDHSCGLISHLPIHAAGDYFEESSRNTLSNVVSSHSPTFKALANLRKRTNQRLDWINSNAVVAMPQTANYADHNVSD